MNQKMFIPVVLFLVSMRYSQLVFGDKTETDLRVRLKLMTFQANATNVNWNFEKKLKFLKNTLVKRIRCGNHQKICEDCLSVQRILNMTKDADPLAMNRSDKGEYTQIQNLSFSAVVFLNYFLSFKTSCTEESIRNGYVGNCRTYSQCWEELHINMSENSNTTGADKLEKLENILRKVKSAYEPDPSQPCFSAEKVMSELKLLPEKFQNLDPDIATVLLITSHLFVGECIDVGESVADFLDDIFRHYGDECEQVITQSGFTKLWRDLLLKRNLKHLHHGVTSKSCGVTKSQPLHPDPNIDEGTGETAEVVTTDSSTTSRSVRHAPSTAEHEHKNLANECLPSEDLLKRFLTYGNKVITSTEFMQICPALVQQVVSGVCNAQVTTKTVSADTPVLKVQNETVILESDVPEGSTWHAVAAVSCITTAGFLGFCMVPFLNQPSFTYISAFFMGLGFGTMAADVVLHIMPQYLGLHKHDEDGHDHQNETFIEQIFPSHLQLQLLFLLTMYTLFLAECVFSTLTGEKKEYHGHSHEVPAIHMKDMSVSSDVENAEATHSSNSCCRRIIVFLKPSNLCSGFSSKAVVILLADTVHNFADGMAIAVGFSTSYKDGLSTSIAVFLHELPHEIGDLAILMTAGLGYWKAILFNILSGIAAFIGLGVGVFTASVFREWLMSITAGLFFFVVMGEMLPDMRMQSKKEWKIFVVKIFGTIFGIIIMICIAMYEQ